MSNCSSKKDPEKRQIPNPVIDYQINEAQVRILRQSFLDSSDAIMITDRDGIIVDVNPAFTGIYGYSAEEAIGMTPSLLRHPHRDADLYKVMWRGILDPEVGFWRGEILNRCKDGSDIPVMLSITPIRDENGETTHYMGLAIDVTDKKVLEDKVERLRREYGFFIRHELRNLLAAIIGYHEMALTLAEPVPPKLNKYLSSARDAGLATLKIVDMLRDLDYYETGRVKIEKQKVRLGDVVQNAVEHLRPLAQSVDIEVKVRVDTDSDTVSVDTPKMESVFVNLLKNAIEHISGIPDEVVRVRLYEEGKFLAVSVNNGGEPIPPERLITFFERFNTTKKNIGGTGLGTTFAELITRAHDGKISVKSSAEEGTTVTVMIPGQKSHLIKT
ncbi:hypothetical protein CEE37_13880 [candidate division LCP-89 bacterium B3_LCP]|uniref:histidine kinase n=1 Tax=candidate division LCP-89 bacterium B3_LCP TaxID=2012998 RepID=A0A532URN8_UNCL8|nr:MAG: hypothetical protein CEE37_13880 [candidate division LCP-89 bacterium B3_LCP]